MDAASEFFKDAEQVQNKPISESQWAEGVECYQRAKLMTEAVGDLVKALAEQTGKTAAQIRFAIKARADSKESEARDDLQGRLELLGGGNEHQ